MRRLSIIFILLTFFYSQLFANTPNVLSLNKFIRTSLKKHPMLGLSYNQYLSKLKNYQATNSMYETNLFLNAYYSKGNINPFTTQFNDDFSSLSVQSGLYKILPTIGAELSVNANYQKQLNNGSIPTGVAPISFPDAYSTALSITLKKSLSKNLTGLQTSYPLKVSAIQKEQAKEVYLNDLQEFLGVITLDYLNWRHCFITVQILNKQLTNNEKQIVLMKKQYLRGTLEKREYLQAKQQSKQQKLLLLIEKDKLNRIENKLSTSFYGKVSSKPFYFYPEELPFYFKQPLTKNTVKKNHLLSLVSLNTKIADILSEKEKDNQRQQIDLIATINTIGTGSTQSLATDSIQDNRTYTLGLEVLTPFLSKEAKARFESSVSNKEALRLHYDKAYNELKSQQKALYRTISALTELSKESSELVSISNELVKEETIAYKQGRLPSFSVVIQTQNTVLSTKLQQESIKHQLLLTNHYISLLENDYRRFYKLKDYK